MAEPVEPRPTMAEKNDLMIARMRRETNERLETQARRRQVMEDIKEIVARFTAATKPHLDKLVELAQDDLNAQNGLVRKYTPEAVVTLRADARRAIRYADGAQNAELAAFRADSDNRAAAAIVAAGTGLDDQARIASMMEAEQLARTVDAVDLVTQAHQHVALGDPYGALVRVQAAKLIKGTGNLKGLAAAGHAVEEALNEVVPARKTALADNWQDRLAMAEASIAAMKIQRLAASLVGDQQATALASVKEKTALFQLARQKGIPYEGQAGVLGSEATG